MKGKIGEEKGITLIALIITIVVLLILAVVSINSIQNEGILSYAENATSQFQQAQENESKGLQEYVNFLENATNPSNTEPEEPVEPEVTLITFTLDDVEYQIEEVTWREWCTGRSDYSISTFPDNEDYLANTSSGGVVSCSNCSWMQTPDVKAGVCSECGKSIFATEAEEVM